MRRVARAARGFALTEARYDAGSTLAPHAHERPVLTFILAGHVQERCVAHGQVCDPRSLVVIPAGAPHGETFPSPGARCLIVEMSGERAAVIGDCSRLFDEPKCASGGEVASLGMQLHREFRHIDDVTGLAIEGLIFQISAAAVRAGRRPLSGAAPSWLVRARDAIHASVARAVSITDLALAAGVHPVHFTRAFARWYGCPPAEYLRRLRIEAACQALTHSDASLADIALASGFADQSHMSRQFQRRIGMTPGRFRRTAASSV
jgi:AraC family transcriptional regulator